MESIIGHFGIIHFGSAGYKAMNEHITASNYSSIFILVDSNTHDHCLEHFLSHLDPAINYEVFEIEPGEEHKNLETSYGVWEALSDLGGDRRSLMINLGGGVVTDLGGFVASVFKRGIDFINVPTSLLAMVDASIGGKTGVDLDGLKNQIGVINMGVMVIIDVEYLKTLPENHVRSGTAEMYKHGLIADPDYWMAMAHSDEKLKHDPLKLIYDSIGIKYNIVKEDPTEKSIRKALNYGHTLGHAIETYYLVNESLPTLLHGEAIAIGMIMEAYISHKQLGLPSGEMESIKTELINRFGRVDIKDEYRPEIISLLKHDKKNTHGRINFVLLDAIGSFKLDQQVEESLLVEAFDFYRV
ncbi:MAG: 3-dehydroquinate synthase [Flavobacteriaceae bacterium]|nr:3-dehydroquinate synthase [Flavobacteriaceae bacterium]